jgi:sugar phosphate isomerase/epimerase
MKTSFLTLGCPNWDLETICRVGRENHYNGVDFRGYLEELDITRLPEFTTKAAGTRRQLEESGLAVSGISSSIQVCNLDAKEQNLEEARRTIPVALALGCQNVRIFGGGDLERFEREELAKIGRDCIESILSLEGAQALHWLFETHDLWINSRDCRLLLEAIPNPAFGALWDMGHTARVGGESPQESYQSLAGRIGYTHVKDAVYDPGHPQAMQDGWRYVLPGQGQLPLADAAAILFKEGYQGWFVFEHEKRWHPELPEPEIAIPAFARWFRSVSKEFKLAN